MVNFEVCAYLLKIRKGPTAILNSCLKIDTLQTYNHLLNQKFLPQFLESEMKPLFIDHPKIWGEKDLAFLTVRG